MKRLIFEYLLKGIFLGLLGYLAITTPDAATLFRAIAIVAAGVTVGILAAVFTQSSSGLNRLSHWLFAMLERPWPIYAGAIVGAATAAILAEPANGLLGAFVGGGTLLGTLLAWVAHLSPQSKRWFASLVFWLALTLAVAWLFDPSRDIVSIADRRLAGCMILLGLPIFALLTFISVAEETEAEVAAGCAALGVGSWLIPITPGVPGIALIMPVAIFWLYTRRMQTGVSVFKHVLRGMSFDRLGQTSTALAILQRATELDAGNRLARDALWSVHRNLDAAKVADDPDLFARIDPRVCLDRAAGLLLAEHITPAQRSEARHLLDLVERRSIAFLPSTMYWRAVAFAQDRDFDRAAANLNRLLDPNQWTPDDPERSKTLFAAWRLALVLQPDLQRLVGEPQLQLPGRRLDAIAAAERELADGSNDANAWMLKRILYSGLTLADFAAGPVAEFDAAYVQQLGLALIDDRERWRRGVEYLQISAAGMPVEGASLFRTIAEACEKHGDAAGARTAFENAVHAGLSAGLPTLPDKERQAYFASVKRLADDALACDRLDDAIKHFLLLTAHDRAGVETWRTLAGLYERRGDAVAATRAVEQALVYTPKDADLLARRDRCYYSIEPDMIRGDAALRSGLDGQYCLTRAKQLLVHANADSEVLAWARHLAELATVLVPDSVAAQVTLAQAELRSAQRTRAVELLEAVQASKPSRFSFGDDEEAWYLACRILGDLYLRELDQPDRAVKCYLAYRQSSRSGADTLFKLAEAYEALGEPARAGRYYEQVAAYDGHPLGPDARAAIARLGTARS